MLIFGVNGLPAGSRFLQTLYLCWYLSVITVNVILSALMVFIVGSGSKMR